MSYGKKLSDEELIAIQEVVSNWGGYTVELSKEQALSIVAEVMESRQIDNKVSGGTVSQIDLFDTMSAFAPGTTS